MFDIEYSTGAKEDLKYWKSHDPKMLERIDKMIENIKLTLFSGIGKPESLKYDRSRFWSRMMSNID